MLPVKIPKVPTTANKKEKDANELSASNKKNQSGSNAGKTGNATDKDKSSGEMTKNKSPLAGKELQASKFNSKILSKMKK